MSKRDELEIDEEHLWEDEREEEEDEDQDYTRISSDASNSRIPRISEPGTPRRRKVGIKNNSIVVSPSRKRSAPLRTRQTLHPRRQLEAAQNGLPAETAQPDVHPILTAEETRHMLGLMLRSAIHYLHGVVTMSFKFLKYPTVVLVVSYVAMIMLAHSSAMVHNALQNAFSPLCWMPPISSAPFCSPKTHPASPTDGNDPSKKAPPQKPDYPSLVGLQSESFEQLLEERADGSRLALEIKKSELATGDLITLVKASQLKSRIPLATNLQDFMVHAKKTGAGLQKFNARLGGAVDSIMASNQRAAATIQEAISTKRSTLEAAKVLIWPFGQDAAQIAKQETVMQQFRKSFETLTTQLETLISYAEVSVMNLDALQEKLGTIHEIVVEEDGSLSAEQQEILARLWTKLGGNQHRVKSFEAHLGLLKDIGSYRRRALAHVAGALYTLNTLAAEVEDLRLRVNAPQLLGDDISPEEHVESIKLGIQRLHEGALRAQIREPQVVREILGVEME